MKAAFCLLVAAVELYTENVYFYTGVPQNKMTFSGKVRHDCVAKHLTSPGAPVSLSPWSKISISSLSLTITFPFFLFPFL